MPGAKAFMLLITIEAETDAFFSYLYYFCSLTCRLGILILCHVDDRKEEDGIQ
jgi:hypothetical protein